MRRAAKQDANATELVEFARDAGMVVEYIGLPVDLLVGHRGFWYPVEIKTKTGDYTYKQKLFSKQCNVYNLPFITWRTITDIENMLGWPKKA